MVLKEQYDNFLLAKEEEWNHHRVVLKRYHWLCMKQDIAHIVKAWVDAKWTEPLTTFAYPAEAMA